MNTKGALVLSIAGIVFGAVMLRAFNRAAPSHDAVRVSTTNIEQAIDWLGSGITLAPDIPTKQLPDYTVVNFDSVSIKHAKPSWRVVADSARLYNPQNVLHLKKVTAHVFKGGSTPTLITAREGKLLTQNDQMELYGDVVATFPDGTVIRSDFMRYFDRFSRIEIPLGHAVSGERKSHENRSHFKSEGLIYDGKQDIIVLPNRVVYTVVRPVPPHTTEVQADRAVVQSVTRTATFTVRPEPNRHVLTRQKDFLMRSRMAEVFYGQDSKRLHFLKAHEDVYFQEGKDRAKSRYGTCGVAEFDANANVIYLTKFPQVYENEDTITGDRIRLDREHDVVEVEGSNAYSDRNGAP